MIRTKRVYDPPSSDDGFRVLVDRLWPRGLAKEQARVDLWLRDAAPSDALRRWFGHDPARWDEFRQRYAAELDTNERAWATLPDKARSTTVTLLFAARDAERNNAVALKTYLANKGVRRR